MGGLGGWYARLPDSVTSPFAVPLSHEMYAMFRYDISVLWPEGHPKREAAKSILRARNPNRDNMNNPAGLEGLARRFVAFGGGIGETQMRWIRENLEEARSKGERVIVCSHQVEGGFVW